MRTTHRSAIVVVTLLLAVPRARAEGTAASAPVGLLVRIEGDAAGCPSPAQMEVALRATLPSLTIADAPDALAVVIKDEGAGFSISAGELTRHFEDRTRRCTERADKAAVYVSLVAPAPTARAPQPSTSSTPDPDVNENLAPVAPASPPSSVRGELHWPSLQLESAALFSLAPRGANAAVTGGGALRFFVGNRYVGGVIGVTGLAPVTLAFSGATTQITRVPIELGVRGRLVLPHRVALTLDGTLVLAPLVSQGSEGGAGATETRLEVGLALVARVEYWVTYRLAPYVQFAVEGIPKSYHFTDVNGNVVGSTSQAWLTFSVGLAVRL